MNKLEQLSKSIDEISKAIHTVEEVYDKVTILNTGGIEEIEDLTTKLLKYILRQKILIE